MVRKTHNGIYVLAEPNVCAAASVLSAKRVEEHCVIVDLEDVVAYRYPDTPADLAAYLDLARIHDPEPARLRISLDYSGIRNRRNHAHPHNNYQ